MKARDIKKAVSEAAKAMNAARQRALTPEQRQEIARRAGKAGGRGRPKKDLTSKARAS